MATPHQAEAPSLWRLVGSEGTAQDLGEPPPPKESAPPAVSPDSTLQEFLERYAWPFVLATIRKLATEMQRPAPRPAYNLDEPAVSPAVSPDSTLREFCELYAWPLVLAPSGDCERTRLEYRYTLTKWEKATGDPPVRQIDPEHLAAFLAALRKLATETQRKHCRQLQRLFDLLGPPGPACRQGAGLVEQSPYLARPRSQRPAPREAYNLDEIARILAACCSAHETKMIPAIDPATWWRALILTAYNTGQRPGTLLRIRWEWIAGPWLTIPPGAIKGHRGNRIYLNAPARDAMTTLGRVAGPVFPWKDWPRTESPLHAQRRKIWAHADPAVRNLGLYGLRRAFASQLVKAGEPLAAQIMLNHSGLGFDMMKGHYLDPETVLPNALAKLPQPPEANLAT